MSDLGDVGVQMTPLVTVIGTGPVGVALAGKLTRAGVPVAAIYGKTFAEADAAAAEAGVMGLACEVSALVQQANVAIIAVADDKVEAVAKEYSEKGVLGRGQIVLHTCGAWAAEELLADLRGKVRAVGTVHPLASISSRKQAFARLERVSFGIEGDQEAVAVAERLVAFMGGKPLRLDRSQMPLYHAGAAMGSNLVVAVIELARRALEGAGIHPDHVVGALVPLLRSTAKNLEDHGLPHALTGPVARGDVKTIERHLGAIDHTVPDVGSLYRQLGHEVLTLAEKKVPAFEAKVAARLRELFSARVERSS